MLVPIIPFFAFCFFYIKYYVDKYNLVFVYFKVYESGGKIRNNVTFYMVFNLLFYLLVIVSFFSLKFQTEYLWGGSIMIVTWFIIYYYTKQQLMNEFNLDADLIKIKRTKSDSVVTKSVMKQFRKQQKKALSELPDGPEQWEYQEEQKQRVKDFEERIKQVILFNEQALRKSYLHPFQQINKKLYSDSENRVSDLLQTK